MNAAKPEPPPIESDNKEPVISLILHDLSLPFLNGFDIDIVSLMREDFKARAEAGLKKYGMRLRANNGRDALMDAYQEAIDLCNYLRQAIDEGDVNNIGLLGEYWKTMGTCFHLRQIMLRRDSK